MAKKKYIDYKKQQQELFKRTEGYAFEVRKIYQECFTKIINLVKGTELSDGVPFSFSEYGYSEEVTPILRNMYSRVYQTIRGGVEKEWEFSNKSNDELVKGVFGENSVEDNHFAKLFQRNQEAMNAFFSRVSQHGGMNLSQKVWNYTGQFKEELEKTLDLAIGEGTPAKSLAAKIQGYLNEPDRYYRRFRIKIGEDENGNPIYGRKWKRRTWDKESQSYKWIDANPKDYKPGRGVYRSSSKNAQRLARTETNIAYRTADYTRWQQLEFVIGVEIKLSNNHPCVDICDDLKGIYPKSFKWTGWHPNCRCYMVPVLAKETDMDKMLDEILNGEDPGNVKCDNEVKELPGEFKTWMSDNQDRIQDAKERGTLPYFLMDNKRLVGLENYKSVGLRRKEIAKSATSLLLGIEFTNPDFGGSLKINKRGIKEWLNQPHSLYADKNEILLDLSNTIEHSNYRGWTYYHKDNPMVTKTHVFEININNETSYIIAREYLNGDVYIYSISESDKVLIGIQK